jgi:hypothetical protein
MRRAHIVAMLGLIVAIPAAAAGSFFSSNAPAKPCFIAGNTGYEMSERSDADIIVRIDNAALTPNLRMQLIDDPSQADFVLVDDGETDDSCKAARTMRSVRLDPAASAPDLTIALSHDDAPYKIYLHSAHYTEQDAAALFAAIWRNARKTASAGREFAERH